MKSKEHWTPVTPSESAQVFDRGNVSATHEPTNESTDAHVYAEPRHGNLPDHIAQFVAGSFQDQSERVHCFPFLSYVPTDSSTQSREEGKGLE
jgi:hypothetical protein